MFKYISFRSSVYRILFYHTYSTLTEQLLIQLIRGDKLSNIINGAPVLELIELLNDINKEEIITVPSLVMSFVTRK